MLGKSMVLLNNVYYLVAYSEGSPCMLGDAMKVIGGSPATLRERGELRSDEKFTRQVLGYEQVEENGASGQCNNYTV